MEEGIERWNNYGRVVLWIWEVVGHLWAWYYCIKELNKIFVFFSGFQDDTDFGDTVKFLDATFGVDFTYGDAFDFESISSWAFEYDNVSCEFSVERRLRRRRKKRRTNCVFRFENIKKSCWYRYITRPGVTREITHELSSSDRFGEFWHWFCMPLSKVEEDLTNILIDR